MQTYEILNSIKNLTVKTHRDGLSYVSVLYSSSFEACTASSFIFYQNHSFCTAQSIFADNFSQFVFVNVKHLLEIQSTNITEHKNFTNKKLLNYDIDFYLYDLLRSLNQTNY